MMDDITEEIAALIKKLGIVYSYDSDTGELTAVIGDADEESETIEVDISEETHYRIVKGILDTSDESERVLQMKTRLGVQT